MENNFSVPATEALRWSARDANDLSPLYAAWQFQAAISLLLTECTWLIGSSSMAKLCDSSNLVFGIPQPNRFVYLVVSLFSVLLFGGIIFGWSELQVAFEREAYFSGQCSNNSLDADVNNVDKNTNKIIQSPRAAYLQRSVPCANLNSQFGEIFFIGCIAATIVPVIIGPIQDRLSNMWARIFAACMVSSGLVCISFAGKESLNLVKLGAALLGAGGNGYQLTSFPMAALFPGNEGLVSSLCTGFFSLSSLVFFSFRLLQSNYGFSLSACAMYYTYVSAAFLFLSFIWPHHFSKSEQGADAPTIAQDEAGYSMRISARQSRQSVRLSRARAISLSVSEGRHSCASFSPATDSADVLVVPAARTTFVRPTWHGASNQTTSKAQNATTFGSTKEPPALITLAPIVIDVPSDGTNPIFEDSVGNDRPELLTKNEEISQKLQLSLLSGAQQLRSREYIALVINFLIGSLVSDFYIGSYLQQTRRLPAKCSSGDTLVDCDAQKLALFQTSWSSIYPCGAIASPLFGIAMDKLQFRRVFVLVVLVSICHQVTNLIPIVDLQFVTYVIFACGRQVIFGFFYSSLGILFGFTHYGLLTSASSGFVATLIYVNKIIVDASESADSYFVANVTFLALTVCLLALQVAFKWGERRLSQSSLEPLLSK